MPKKFKRQEERIRQRHLREKQNPFSRLPSIYAASRRQSEQLLRTTGISIVEWRTLWDLSEAGPMSVSDLAEIQRTDRSLLSRALPAMRRKGLVDVERNSDDGRQTIVVLTDKGRAIYNRAAPIMKHRRDALRETMTAEEINTLVRLFDKFEAYLRTPVEDLVPPHLLQED